MNWNKIKEKYPKAWSMFNKNIFDTDVLNGTLYCRIIRMDDLEIYPLRDLYDFFDEQGVYIGIHYLWKCWIQTEDDENGEYEYYEDIDGNNRTEAEEKAFEKAFEILEGKL